MKKLFVLALAAAAMVACVNEDIVETPKSNEISFENAFIENATRAELNNDNLNSFAVWGYVEDAANVLFAGTEVKKANGTWGYEGKQYWLPGKTHYFTAVAPYGAVADEAVVVDGGKLEGFTYTITDGNTDLLYVTKSVMANDASTGNDAVALNFNHILSKVAFTFTNGYTTLNENNKIVVKEVTLKAAESAYYNGAEWSNQDGEKAIVFGETDKINLNEHEQTLVKFVIPSAEYTVEFKVDVYFGNNESAAYETTVSSTISGVEFQKGQAYNLSATITPETLEMGEITFSTDVNPWGDEYNYLPDTNRNEVLAKLAEAVEAGQTDIIIDAAGATIGDLNYGLTKANVPEGVTVTLKNAKVEGRSYGNGVDGTVIFENCEFNNPGGAYSIHFDNGEGKVIFKNCDLYGWNSFGGTLESVAFYDSRLYGNGTYALIRSYADMTLENCIFDLRSADPDDADPDSGAKPGDGFDEGVQIIRNGKVTNVNTDEDDTAVEGLKETNCTYIYDNGVVLSKAETYELSSVNSFKWLAESVSAGADFTGKTVALDADIDLTGVTTNGDSFGPIGRYCSGQGVNKPFTGNFNGNYHTIKGIYQSGWDFGYEWGTTGYLGLFGYVKDATIENLTIEGMESVVEGGTLAAVAGRADGECTFKNITVKDSQLGTYNNRCGGIVGWSGGYYKDEAQTEVACHFTFENIEICEDVVLGGLWGSFDSSIGGVMGQLNSAGSASFKNVTVSCRIDAYNDCTASYDYYNYRMCGMLIGQMTKTTEIDGSTYPDVAAYGIEFDNVTVNYGKWMNYHYCEPTPGLNGGRGMRVEPGFAYDGIPADFDHTLCVDNHYNCIPFDQLFGGTQTACKGVKAWEGVTVNYPAAYTCELCGETHNE